MSKRTLQTLRTLSLVLFLLLSCLGTVQARGEETARLVAPVVTPGSGSSEPADPVDVPGAAPDESPVAPLPVPWFPLRVAEPRAGIAGITAANADNLMLPLTPDPNEPAATLPTGHRIWVRSDYEAVVFPRATGEAKFELEVYRVAGPEPVDGALPDDAGDSRELIGSDHAVVVGSGPLRRAGSLHAYGALNAPGRYRLEIVSRTSARGIGGRFVVDVDTVFVWVIVSDDTIVVPPPLGRPQEAAPVVSEAPASPERLARALTVTEPPVVSPPEPPSEPTDQYLQVASPRGHFLSSSLAAVENFDQNHGRTLTVRQGDAVTFSSAYEFVWFQTAGGSGETELVVRLESAREQDPALGEDRAEVAGGDNGHRMAGALQAVVPFDEIGQFVVLVTVRTKAQPAGPLVAGDDAAQDLDIVRVAVEVLGQPQVGAISGLVSADTGTTTGAAQWIPLGGVVIQVYHASTGRLVRTTRTGADGAYTAAGLEPGAYLVYADPQGQSYLPEWYDNQPTRQQAHRVPVAASETTPGISFALSTAGVLSGFVYEDDPDGTSPAPVPIPDVTVLVGPYLVPSPVGAPVDAVEPGAIARTRTQRDGSYRVEGLPTGDYWVYAGDESLSLIPEFFDDKPTRAEADRVAVSASAETKDINFRLRYGGAIAGRVVGVSVEPAEPLPAPDIGAIPVAPFRVTAYDWDTGEAVRTVGVGRGGSYVIPSLPEGAYRVYAYDQAGQYIPEYYDDVTDPAEATRVVVVRATTVGGIDFVLGAVGIATVEIRPSVSQVLPGQEFEVAVWVRGVRDLGGFSFDLAYSAATIELVDGSFERGDLLGSTGREVFELGPNVTPGLISYGAGTYGDEPGADGEGVLATIKFLAVGGGSSLLDLQNVELTDTDGQPIRSRHEDGRVSVGECIFGDFDCDCDVDTDDIMQVALRWGTERGDPNYDPRYDVDSDSDIDIFDIMLVAAAWGNTCDDAIVPSASLGGVQLSSRLLATGLRLEPEKLTASVGQPVVLQVWADDAQDLAGFEFSLTYDAARVAIAPNAVTLGAWVGSTGRSAYPVGPNIEVGGEQGTLAYGAWSIGYTPPGPSGSGVLAEITLTPTRPGTVAVDLTRGQVTSTTGESQEQLALQGADLQIEAGERLVRFMPVVLR